VSLTWHTAQWALAPKLHRLFELSAAKIRSIEKSWEPSAGAPVFTFGGEYTSRGWTEWTQGFQFGAPILQFDATGDRAFLDYGRDHTVKLMVDGKGNFTYHPTLLRVRPGDTIQFDYDGHWEIMFKERTPGNKLFLWQDDSILTINANAEYAVYHYAAAVKKGNRVFLDSACGDIAVES